MSIAKIATNKYDTRMVFVNGRQFYLPCIVNIETADTYSFRVEHRNGQKFLVWGGKKSGGRACEWFVDGWPSGGSIKCSGLVDALKLLNGM